MSRGSDTVIQVDSAGVATRVWPSRTQRWANRIGRWRVRGERVVRIIGAIHSASDEVLGIAARLEDELRVLSRESHEPLPREDRALRSVA